MTKNPKIRIAISLSPSDAEQWVSSVANISLRNQEMEIVAENWLSRDPAGARVWIKQASLPPTVKTRFLPAR
jgi:hypothetical protein